MNEDTTELAEPTPLCLGCLEPVDPLMTECPHCGAAVGQLTPYLPWESIRWEAQGWGKMWDQAWKRTTSTGGRVVRFAMILWFVPILLAGLLPGRRGLQNGS